MTKHIPAKGATCAVAGSAGAARKKIKARGDSIPKGATLKKARIGRKVAYCTKVKAVKKAKRHHARRHR